MAEMKCCLFSTCYISTKSLGGNTNLVEINTLDLFTLILVHFHHAELAELT
ncbi:hypothetical protein ASZ90_000091 [hydrocarbon metagenome]|uniref:Uncharacterized protein n=1 Tax=hydrocarbon metagenome TaxID=938273 RepID=A0A0W8GA79_9ZZZZ